MNKENIPDIGILATVISLAFGLYWYFSQDPRAEPLSLVVLSALYLWVTAVGA